MKPLTLLLLITLSCVAARSYAQDSAGIKKQVLLNLDDPRTYKKPIVIYDSKITIAQHGPALRFNENVDIESSGFVSPLTFSATVFSKNLAFINVDLDSLSYFYKAKFSGTADFITTNFHGWVNFEYSEFDSTANFRLGFGSDRPMRFSGPADFKAANFRSYASFGDVIFEDRSDFPGSKFGNLATFDNVEFRGKGDFSFANFSSLASFVNVRFRANADFFDADFQDDAIFTESRFFPSADFHSVRFTKALNFTTSRFISFANLSDLRTTGATKISFFNTRFPDLLDFSNNGNLANEVSFTEGDFDSVSLYTSDRRRWHYLNLYKTDLSKIKLDGLHFRLCFYDAVQGDPVLDSLLKKVTIPEDGHPFAEKLMKFPEVRAYLRDVFPMTDLSDTVVVIFLNQYAGDRFPRRLPKDEVNSIVERILKKFDGEGLKESHEVLETSYTDYQNGWFILPHLWNGYGYHKEWVFYWAGILLVLFTLITFPLLPSFNKPPEQNGVYYIATIPSSFGNIFKRIWYSLLYTAIIFFLFSLKIENLNFRKGAVLYIIVVYGSGILCIAYMANFVLQK